MWSAEAQFPALRLQRDRKSQCGGITRPEMAGIPGLQAPNGKLSQVDDIEGAGVIFECY
jgi:hypothetical protein